VSEPSLSVLRGDFWEVFCDGLVEGFAGACFGGAEQYFEFAPCFFDGVEVGRVGWQIKQIGTCSLDAFANALHLMRGEVVHDDQVSGLQLRAEDRVEVGEEDLGVGGGLDRHCGDHSADAHRSQDGEDFPVAFGRTFMHARSLQAACEAPRHLSRDATLIEENQLLRRGLADAGKILFAPDAVGFGVALGGVE
jgi:hypothetical protein